MRDHRWIKRRGAGGDSTGEERDDGSSLLVERGMTSVNVRYFRVRNRKKEEISFG